MRGVPNSVICLNELVLLSVYDFVIKNKLYSIGISNVGTFGFLAHYFSDLNEKKCSGRSESVHGTL